MIGPVGRLRWLAEQFQWWEHIHTVNNVLLCWKTGFVHIYPTEAKHRDRPTVKSTFYWGLGLRMFCNGAKNETSQTGLKNDQISSVDWIRRAWWGSFTWFYVVVIFSSDKCRYLAFKNSSSQIQSDVLKSHLSSSALSLQSCHTTTMQLWL